MSPGEQQRAVYNDQPTAGQTQEYNYGTGQPAADPQSYYNAQTTDQFANQQPYQDPNLQYYS